jgi:tetratricopeptide (TPR) repeat protein
LFGAADEGLGYAPHSRRETEARNAIAGFWLLCARRLADLNAGDADAQLDVARAWGYLGQGSGEWRALKATLEAKPTKAEPYSYALEFVKPEWTGESDIMTPALLSIRSNAALIHELAPDIVIFLEGRQQKGVALSAPLQAMLKQARVEVTRITAEGATGSLAERTIWYWEKQPDFNRAMAVAQAWVKQAPDDPKAHIAAGRAAMYGGQGATRGMDEYEAALRLQPDNVPVALLLAHHYSDFRKYDLAEPMLRKIVEQSPFSSHALVLLGRVLVGEKKGPEAAEVFLRAADLGEVDDAPDMYVREARMSYSVFCKTPVSTP